MCSGERSSSANGAIALRQSAARSWSTSSSSVLSDWTMRGPSDTGGDALLPGAVRRDVGPRGAAVGAVAARLVGRGVDVDVGAGRGGADAEPGRAEVADEVGQAEQGLADQQVGDARGPVGDVDVEVGRVVV